MRSTIQLPITCVAIGLAFRLAAFGDTSIPERPGIASQPQGNAPSATGLEVEHRNGISFVSGGVGDEQQDALDQIAGQYNLKLTLARSDGKYMGSSTLRIARAGGETVLDTETKGPLFLAKLPAGTYSIHASADGQSYSRTVTVPSTGQEQIVLTWPSEAKGTSAGDAPASKPASDSAR